MSEQQVTLRTRKFIRNPLLSRRQMVLYVDLQSLHQPHSLKENVLLISKKIQRRPPSQPPQLLQR